MTAKDCEGGKLVPQTPPTACAERLKPPLCKGVNADGRVASLVNSERVLYATVFFALIRGSVSRLEGVSDVRSS